MAGPRWLEHEAEVLREAVAARPYDGVALLDLGITEIDRGRSAVLSEARATLPAMPPASTTP